MAEQTGSRRLAAILAADVVGYSRMMGADEAGTLAALKNHRETIFDPAVVRHNGRVVKLIGDGALVEFGSVVDAVNCALAVQRAVKAAAGPNGKGIVLRIGVNLGDVIVDGNDIYGDGVNVAARLEPLAEPGGVCVASIVNESVGGRVDVAFRDGGEVRVKNIDRPIRVWKWHPDSDSAAPVSVSGAAAPAEVRSIAVLPFTNMSGDPEQEYFSDGITEDIITDLSKIGGLLVIARNSSFTYKGKNVDVRTVGRDLGVRSVLEGSIRRAGNRVRITAQLIDAKTGGHLWAERYDRDLTDIFEVQDDVTRHIVEALRVTLTPEEKAMLAETGSAGNVEAHDLFLQGREILSGHITQESVARSRELFERAIALDPGYAAAYAGIAFGFGMDFNNNWTSDPAATIRRADELVTRATTLAPDDPYGWYVLSIIAAQNRDFDRSRTASDKCLALNPNNAPALGTRGAIEIYSGNLTEAIEHIERARRIDPAGTILGMHFLGLANLLLGKYETAAAYLRERILAAPETDLSRVMLASALGHLGQADEARRVWAEVKRINPDYSFATHRSRMPFVDPSDADPIGEGLAKAGLLE
jgi:adenylate cyclase